MLPEAAGWTRRVAIPVLLAVASCGGTSSSCFSESSAGTGMEEKRSAHDLGNEEKVGPGVREAIQQEGSTQVIVSLIEPPSMHARPIDAEAVRRDIAHLQAGLLEDIGESAFRVTHRYENVPALAGSVTAGGLAQLSAHPHVVKIDVDVGGRASPGAGGGHSIQ